MVPFSMERAVYFSLDINIGITGIDEESLIEQSGKEIPKLRNR